MRFEGEVQPHVHLVEGSGDIDGSVSFSLALREKLYAPLIPEFIINKGLQLVVNSKPWKLMPQNDRGNLFTIESDDCKLLFAEYTDSDESADLIKRPELIEEAIKRLETEDKLKPDNQYRRLNTAATFKV
uniref:Uncharacterized protein n=1 Tax=Chromera velia CCMP2878 TaxID=1169474 RepID=A0A0G4ICR9_9ALVE|eukprot:Cvel_13112.t1-p1 / transcript=Cvel_13112.t1 / gene=Cvel_13112 / organism=Chromera_velia_CCMP2878 / gene_product=hypothetical protein / transcript_product=hypothetical protein / location=Cvel_scaffold883:54342-56537(+) / protein_length=129 / sequence_SO=supercontig / SO=protein_coding / is_pseudo=false